MVANSNIFSILPSQSSVERSPAPERPASDEPSFQTFLEDSIKRPPSAREKQQVKEEPGNFSSAENSTRPAGKEKSSIEDRSSQSNSETAHATRPTDGTQGTDSTDKGDGIHKQLAEHLDQLDIDRENLDALLGLLDGKSQEELLALLQSLNFQAGDLQKGLAEGSSDPLLTQENLITKLNHQKSQVLDLLKQAGLSDQQAKDLLEKINLAQLNKPAPAEILTDKARITSATEQSGQEALNRQAAGKNASDSKADFFTQFGVKSNGIEPSERGASINKILDHSNQNLDQNPANENSAKTAFLNAGKQQAPTHSQNLNTLLQSQGLVEGVSIKGPQGTPLSGDSQAQTINPNIDSATRITEPSKPALSQPALPKGTTETKVINQIMDRFSLNTRGGQSEIKIKLDPPSLGSVRMNITTSGESVRTVIVTENHAVKQVIENNFSQLRDSMNGQGLKIDNFTVLVGGESGHQSQNGQQQDDNSLLSSFMRRENPVLESESDRVPEAVPIFNNDLQAISVFA